MGKSAKFLRILLAVVVGLFFSFSAVWYFDKGARFRQPVVSTEYQIPLNELSNSGQAGMVLIKEVNGKVVIRPRIGGVPKEKVQSVYIFRGQCNSLGQLVYRIFSAREGKTTSTFNFDLDSLKRELPLSLVIAQSEEEKSNFAACGEIIL